jgi:uncharacterized membrane protein YfcA
MWITLLILFICSFLAFSISAICGGGAGIMLMPVLGGLLPVNQVPAALSIGTFTSSASRLLVFKKNICWKIVKYFLPVALPAVWIGAWLLKFVDPVYLEIVMGLFMISNIPFIFKKPQEINEVAQPTNFSLLVIGFLTGFLSGLTGAVGLLFNRFYFRYGLTNEEIVATRAANEIILHLVKVILYTLFGLISVKVVSMGVVVALSAILSTWVIKRVLPKLNSVLFKRIGYSAMVVSGFIMLSQSGLDVVAANQVDLTSNIRARGLETKLKWQNVHYTLEFTYNEGFEFEQVIPIEDLTASQKEMVFSKNQNADKIVIEVVYGIASKSYEAYYFEKNKFIDKIDFE